MAIFEQYLASERLREISLGASLAWVAVPWLFYRVAVALYNISPLHPLSHIPGPRLAAMSFFYEFWYDVVLGGKFTGQIAMMHKVYGPVVRINPQELHVSDGQLLDDIYSHGNRIRDKSVHMSNNAGGALRFSGFGTVHHELHRVRRAAVSRYFSRSNMLRLEPSIAAYIEPLCAKMLRIREPYDVQQAYACITGDIITQYAFGESPGFVEQEGWLPNYMEQTKAMISTVHLFRFFPPLRWLMTLAPYMRNLLVKGKLKLLMTEMLVNAPQRVRNAKADIAAGNDKSDTVLCSILKSDLPESDKAPERLSGESFALLLGGIETTAKTLSIITYHLLSKPHILDTLRTALKDHRIDPEKLSWTALEKVPYLEAVILEGLRLGYAVAIRQLRVARTEVLVYKSKDGKMELSIPKGTPIGTSTTIIHRDEDVFPDPDTYNPQRWTQADPAHRKEMDKYFMAFSKGSRQCVGMSLAWCELYLITAAMALKVLPHLRLYKTDQDDITYDSEYGVYLPRKESKGIRVQLAA
ncbi:cytochrome P450 [Microdochium bolleyi]|uniref:Cytochrome P450 n=1 Tax=Microdochium bolleyi TaxID=196109 RepID=A0A136ITL4_9PEZI|nr:cytochrome P450 [Microdochium bolleyi]